MTEVANDIVVGAADAGIVYDAVLHTYPDLQFVELPELASAASQVSIGVIATTKQPQAALHFARYVSARDRGLKHYAEHGFHVSGGDRWSDVPELSMFAGSMLRPAIDETITAFEQREGVTGLASLQRMRDPGCANESGPASGRLFCLRHRIHEPGSRSVSRIGGCLAE